MPCYVDLFFLIANTFLSRPFDLPVSPNLMNKIWFSHSSFDDNNFFFSFSSSPINSLSRWFLSEIAWFAMWTGVCVCVTWFQPSIKSNCPIATRKLLLILNACVFHCELREHLTKDETYDNDFQFEWTNWKHFSQFWLGFHWKRGFFFHPPFLFKSSFWFLEESNWFFDFYDLYDVAHKMKNDFTKKKKN